MKSHTSNKGYSFKLHWLRKDGCKFTPRATNLFAWSAVNAIFIREK